MAAAEAALDSAIAVVGMAGRFAGSPNLDVFWENLKAGVCCIENVAGTAEPRETPWVSARAAIADRYAFDAAFFGISPGDARLLDPQHRLFLETCWHALEEACIDPARPPGSIGVFGGASANSYLLNDLWADARRMSPASLLRVLQANDHDYLTTRVSHLLDLRGPSLCIQTACSSSLVAVHVACQSLRGYECDVALAGGVSVLTGRDEGYPVLAEGIESPEGRCLPFAEGANGTVFGDGVGVVALRRLDDALDAGDPIDAVILGSAVGNDGRDKLGFSAPSERAQASVIAEAIAFAGIDARSIGYIEAHGTGTPLGDPIELAALSRALGADCAPGSCRVGSVKASIGHTYAASGVAGLIKAVLAVRHGVIPGTANVDTATERFEWRSSPLLLATGTEAWDRGRQPRRASVNSLGFGGTNAHVVLEQAEDRAVGAESGSAELLCVSAKSESALRTRLLELAEALESRSGHEPAALGGIAATLRLGRAALPLRSSVVARDAASATAALRSEAQRACAAPVSGGTPTVFLFSPQTRVDPGLVASLSRFDKRVTADLERCWSALSAEQERWLRSLLAAADHADERAVTHPLFVQPVVFAVSWALGRHLERVGVRCSAMVGHSIGEYVAATLAGVFELEDAMTLVEERARIAAEAPAGRMLSVALSEAEVSRRLPSALSLAAVNGPRTCVVSGREADIDALEHVLEAEGVRCVAVPMSYAAHSSLLEPALPRYARALQVVSPKAPSRSWISALDARRIEVGGELEADYWTRHMREPVRFADAIGRLQDEQPDAHWVEIGAGSTLVGLAMGNGVQSPLTALLPSTSPADRAAESFLSGLGKLWEGGVEVDWRALGDEPRIRLRVPLYPFDRREYRVERFEVPQRVSAARFPGDDVDLPGDRRPAVGRDAIGSAVLQIWAALLEVDEVGEDDDFFELGGHSLLAMEIVSELALRFGAAPSLRALLEIPTPSAMADAVFAVLGHGPSQPRARLVPVVPEEESHEPFGLTDLQAAYWLGRREGFAFGSVGSHLYVEIEVDDFDADRFATALRRLIDRHPMLRAVVTAEGQQRVLPEVDVPIPSSLDLRGASESVRDAELARTRSELFDGVFDPEVWPPFEIRVTQLSERTHRLHLCLDFIFNDALSLGIVARDLGRLYREPDAELPEVGLGFGQYIREVEALGTEEKERARRYWRERIPSLPAAPQLPIRLRSTDRHFVRHEGRLASAEWSKLKASAQRRGITVSGIVAAAYAEALAGWSARRAFTLNLPLYNREPIHPDVVHIVGDFSSTLLVEASNRGGTFTARAKDLQAEIWTALDHRAVSGIEVSREISRADTLSDGSMPYVLTSLLGQGVAFGELYSVGGLGTPKLGMTKSPQILIDHQVFENAGELVYTWDCQAGAFQAGVDRQVFDAFERILALLARDEAVWEQEHRSLVSAPARLAAPAEELEQDTPLLLQHPFEERVRKAPDAVAIASDDVVLTYGELDALSSAVARWLADRGIRASDRVAIHVRSGWEQVVAVLGVLKASACYVPLASDLPDSRVEELLKLAEVRAVLTNGDFYRGALPQLRITRSLPPVDPVRATAASSSDLAYIIFTSGSTGTPKGVMIEHGAALNTILDVNERFGIGEGDRVLAVSSLSFDLSVWDIFGPLGAGGAVVFPSPQAPRSPERWVDAMNRHRVTVWNSVPALFDLCLRPVEAAELRAPESLRLLMLSGDWIPVSLPDRARAALGALRIIGMGGATEASIWSIFHEIGPVDRDLRSIPYGRPLRRQRVHVLNEELEPCPVMATGELFIGGEGLARGYLGGVEPERFFQHPRSHERLYRTGDLGRYLPDGNIEFLGRVDRQLKVGGYRIEPGEIESALLGVEGIRDARVVLRGEQASQYLAAYVCAEPERFAAEVELAAVERNDMVRDPVAAPASPASANEGFLRRVSQWQPDRVLVQGARDPELVAGLGAIAKELTWVRDRASRATECPSEIATGASVQILEAEADALEDALGHYDLILLQDGVASLPDLGRLRRMLDAGLARLAEGGRLCLLDVPNARVSRSVALSASAAERPDWPEAGGMRLEQEAALDLRRDPQLWVDPACLVAACPDDYDVSIEVVDRPGRLPSEQCIDAVFVRTRPGEGVQAELGWREGDSIDRIVEAFGAGDARSAIVRDVPDPRLTRWQGAGDSLTAHPASGPRPSEWRPVARTRGVSNRCLASEVDGFYDVLLWREGDEDPAPPRMTPLASDMPEAWRPGTPIEALAWSRIEEGLLRELRESLPHYMVPRRVIALPSFPLTRNGKVDDAALPVGSRAGAAAPRAATAPPGQLQERLLSLYEELLAVDHVRPDEGFFELGGDSLAATRLAARIEAEMGFVLEVTDLQGRAAVRDLVGLIEEADTRPALSASLDDILDQVEAMDEAELDRLLAEER